MAGLPDWGMARDFLWRLMRRALIIGILSLAIGAGIGLAVGWSYPITTVKTIPSALSPDWQGDWILMTAQAFSLDGDLELAKQRLAQLGAGDLCARVAERGAQAIAEGLPPNYIGALARLAGALDTRTDVLAPYLSQ
jgi:hypothetical protein